MSACTCTPATIDVKGTERNYVGLLHAPDCSLSQRAAIAPLVDADVDAIVGVITRATSKATCLICGDDFEFVGDAEGTRWTRCRTCETLLTNTRNRYMVTIDDAGNMSIRAPHTSSAGITSMPATDAYNLAAWLVKTAAGAMGDETHDHAEGYQRFRHLLDAIEVVQ